MNGSSLRRVITEIVVIFIVSIFAVTGGIYLSSFRKAEREQVLYISKFSDVSGCDRYEKLTPPILDNYKDIKEVYIGYDRDNVPKCYIVDVKCANEYGQQMHVLVGIDYESATLSGIKRINDEDIPVPISDGQFTALKESLADKRIPVAFTSNTSVDDSPAPRKEVVINGLHDGVYYAQSVSKDSSGYIDYVEIEVEAGRITKVRWDAVNMDPTTEIRSKASLSGAYSVSGLDWATQSYNICHALIEVQDPKLLNMKSDGTTAVVNGVTCDIRQFIRLSEECIEYAHSGYRKADYYADFDVVLGKLMRGSAESLHLMNKDGFIVVSFDKNLAPFEVKNSDGVVVELRSIHDLAERYKSSGDDKDQQENGDKDKPDDVVPDNDTKPDAGDGSGFVDGGEDGVIDPDSQSDNSLIDSVDDLPMSEIASYVDPVPGAGPGSQLVLTCINTCYKFMKDYLNWLV